MAETATWKYPYPALGQAPDIPGDVRLLAERSEVVTASLDTRIKAIPVSDVVMGQSTATQVSGKPGLYRVAHNQGFVPRTVVAQILVSTNTRWWGVTVLNEAGAYPIDASAFYVALWTAQGAAVTHSTPAIGWLLKR